MTTTTQDQELTFKADRAARIDIEIGKLKEELEILKGDLVLAASKDEENQYENGAGGKSWEIHTSEGTVVCVAFPRPKIITGLDEAKDENTLTQVKKICGKWFAKAFRRVTIWKPAKDIREDSLTQLGRKPSATLLALITTPSSPAVTFKPKPKTP